MMLMCKMNWKESPLANGRRTVWEAVMRRFGIGIVWMWSPRITWQDPSWTSVSSQLDLRSRDWWFVVWFMESRFVYDFETVIRNGVLVVKDDWVGCSSWSGLLYKKAFTEGKTCRYAMNLSSYFALRSYKISYTSYLPDRQAKLHILLSETCCLSPNWKHFA